MSVIRVHKKQIVVVYRLNKQTINIHTSTNYSTNILSLQGIHYIVTKHTIIQLYTYTSSYAY